MTERPFIIAEAGSNWRAGSPERDRQMGRALIDGAVDAGASAVKFQMYRSANVYAPHAGSFGDHCGNTIEDIGKTFEDLELSSELLHDFAEYATSRGIELMCTAFSLDDLAAVDPLVRRHKVASYEMHHVRLWEGLIKTRKPVLFSTGGFEFAAIDRIVDWLALNSAPLDSYTVLHCVASYPADLSALGLNVIRTMADRYGSRGLAVGYSDHSLDPVTAPAAAVAVGATVIEKHFTLNRHLPGPDHPFAIEVPELARMVRACRETYDAVAERHRKGTAAEEVKLQRFAHRALQALRDIAPGEKLVEGENFAILRPGNNSKGASPFEIDRIASRRTGVAIPAGAGIQVNDIE